MAVTVRRNDGFGVRMGALVRTFGPRGAQLGERYERAWTPHRDNRAGTRRSGFWPTYGATGKLMNDASPGVCQTRWVAFW